jgi:outer membrane protein OmpA-like peptidoglycan-associated protein
MPFAMFSPYLRFAAIFLLAAAGGAAAPRIENSTIVLDGAFTFVASTAKLAPESDAAATEFAEFLRAKPTFTRIRIEGNVAEGDSGAAQTLSQARARAVAAKLVALGVECARLLPVGFGKMKPVASAAGAAANTRIEIKVAALRGRAIGGLPEDGGGQTAGDPCAP